MTNTPRPDSESHAFRPVPQAVGDHTLVSLQDETVLVFGLHWSAIVGSRVDALARRKAREARATHYVHGGSGAAAVGCARLRTRGKTGQRLRNKACYAAAQVFARMHPHGVAAGVLCMDGTRTWLAATRDGAVMARSDRIYPDEAAAQAAVAELELLHPGLAGAVHRLSVDDLARSLDPAAAMWRIGLPWGRVPAPAQGVILLLALALLLPPAWRAWQRGPGAPPPPVAVDPARAWHDALSRAAATIHIHDAGQLGRVFQILRQLPTALQDWTLQWARCRPDGSGWACHARYGRTTPHATNQALAERLPASVRALFASLDEADVLWQVTGVTHALQPAALPHMSQTDLRFASVLQAIRPAFARIALGAPAAFAVAPPRDPQGRPLPAPPDLPRLRSRPIVLEGPLRSFALLAQPPATASWSEIALVVQVDRPPDIAQSPLMAQIQGVVYERE
ncbi:type 4b pilus protein PilO2 [Bordetella flabilis]|uniref:Type 4b pilus protein PilO2 n=1 Tax=Bordetella flabilis TaxID=463014 RepID=A0A193GF30_9BORD|nr:type 4b pilus protein PilO2 [Bordetella flabilis]ANN78662.1 hypothetical protein BAU07_17450 [Bordetella flabilis]